MNDFKSLENTLLVNMMEEMNDFDRQNFQNNLLYYTEGVDQMLSVVMTSNGEMYKRAINQSMENVRDLAVDARTLEEFFEGIHDYPNFSSMPLATKVYDLSLIEKIRPVYLTQMYTDIAATIDGYLKGTLSKDDLARKTISDMDITNKRKQLVKTSIPANISVHELPKYKMDTIVDINEEYITTVILPFVRSVPMLIKDLNTISVEACNQITNAYSMMATYATTANTMLKTNKITLEQYRTINQYMYKSYKTFMQVTAYLTFMIIKKIALVANTIRSYNELRIKVLNYHPEGPAVLHENVLTGDTDDMDVPKIFVDAQRNDASHLIAVARSRYETIKGYIAYAVGAERASSISQEIDSSSYSTVGYNNAKLIMKELQNAFNVIRENMKDPAMPFDDIVEKSGLEAKVNSKYAPIVNTISSARDYESYLNRSGALDSVTHFEDQKTVVMMILKELKSVSEEVFQSIVSDVSAAWKSFTELCSDVEVGDPVEFKNEETLKELRVFLDELNPELSNLMASVLRALIARVQNIGDMARFTVEEIYKNPDVEQLTSESEDDVDYEDFAMESYQRINDELNAITFEGYLREYHALRTYYETGMRVVYEDGLATSANAENPAQVNGQNNNNSTASSSGTVSSPKMRDRIKNIIEAIEGFFSKTTNQMQEMMRKQSGNLKWLQDNKQALLNKSFAGVTVNVIPYEKYVNENMILGDLQKLQNNLASLSVDTIRGMKSKGDVAKKLFYYMENLNSMTTENMADVAKKYYKVKNAELEVQAYKGNAVKQLTETMVNYCIGYYSGFVDKLNSSVTNIGNTASETIDKLSTTLMKESVLYEADGDNADNNNQQASNTSTNNNDEKAKTTPNIKVDKKKDVTMNDGRSRVTDGNAQQILGWISSAVQGYIAGVCNATRDRNFDYLKVIKGISGRAEATNSNDNGSNNNTEKQNNNSENQNQNNNENTDNNNSNNNAQ